MQKIKVLHILPTIHGGGVEQFIYNYAYNINSEVFQFDILTQEPRYNDYEKKFKDINVNIYSIPTKKDNIIKWYKGINKVIKDGNYDIVHCHLSSKNIYPLFVAKKCGVKIRISHNHENNCVSGFNKIIYNIYCFVGNKLATDYAACSKAAALKQFGKKNYNNVKIISNSIDTEKFKYNSIERERIRKYLDINDNIILFGQVGRLVEVKNHKFTINLFSVIHDKNPNTKLLIIGDGPLYDDIKKMVNVYKLTDSVVFIKSIDYIYNYYSAMDCLILPSFEEGFGMVAIEAQFCNLHVFASDRISNEIKIKNELCEFFNINDNYDIIANRFLNNVNKFYHRSQIVKNDTFDIKKSIVNLENYYLSLVNKGERK